MLINIKRKHNLSEPLILLKNKTIFNEKNSKIYDLLGNNAINNNNQYLNLYPKNNEINYNSGNFDFTKKNHKKQSKSLVKSFKFKFIK